MRIHYDFVTGKPIRQAAAVMYNGQKFCQVCRVTEVDERFSYGYKFRSETFDKLSFHDDPDSTYYQQWANPSGRRPRLVVYWDGSNWKLKRLAGWPGSPAYIITGGADFSDPSGNYVGSYTDGGNTYQVKAHVWMWQSLCGDKVFHDWCSPSYCCCPTRLPPCYQATVVGAKLPGEYTLHWSNTAYGTAELAWQWRSGYNYIELFWHDTSGPYGGNPVEYPCSHGTWSMYLITKVGGSVWWDQFDNPFELDPFELKHPDPCDPIGVYTSPTTGQTITIANI